MANNSTFVKITNQNIFDEIQSLHKKVEQMEGRITSRQDVTNGKVKKSLWIATTAMSLVLLTLGFLFQHMLK